MRGQCSSQLLEAGSSAGPAVTHCQVRALTWDSTALSTALLSCQHCINNLSNTGVFWPQPSKDGCCHMPVQGALVVDILISENSTQEAQFKCMIYLSRYFSIFSATAGAVSFLNTKILQWSEAAHTRTSRVVSSSQSYSSPLLIKDQFFLISTCMGGLLAFKKAKLSEAKVKWCESWKKVFFAQTKCAPIWHRWVLGRELVLPEHFATSRSSGRQGDTFTRDREHSDGGTILCFVSFLFGQLCSPEHYKQSPVATGSYSAERRNVVCKPAYTLDFQSMQLFLIVLLPFSLCICLLSSKILWILFNNIK